MDERRRIGARWIALLLAVLVIGCPGRTKRKVGPDLSVPTNGDQQALRRFEETRARFKGGGEVADPKQKGQAAAEFEAIARDYPQDPIAPHARLYAGISALDAGQPERAVENLEELLEDESAGSGVKTRGQLFYGIALQAVGRTKDALHALAEGSEALDPDNRDERASYHAAFAEAASQAGRGPEAIAHYDAWYAAGRASERAYALARIRALTDLLDEPSVVRAYERLESKGGPGAAMVGVRLAAQLEATGEAERGGQVRGEIKGALEQLGLATGAGGGGAAGNPDRVGAILSLSGKRNQLGDRSMRGLALVSGSFEDGEAGAGIQMPRPFTLSVRDDASQAAAAEAAMDALAAEGVIAVVGPDDKGAVERVAARARDLGVPMISLHPAAELLVGTSSPVVFHGVHSAEQRARALARRALSAGTRDFAIFAPDNGYGRQVGGAFANEVTGGGGTVVVQGKYPAGATSFATEIRQLRKPFEALFVPDSARALELIAPALAAANLMARPPGSGKTKVGRPIWLLSTADQLTPHFLTSAGRYSFGALLAPGFYADRTDARIAEFTAMYERAFGRAPTALDAYAFDAAWVVRAAVDSGARTRRDVASTLAAGKLDGLTGAITFDSSHRRKDDGVLFEVVETRPEQYELRARR
ncbi:MAG TPA: penicillin-binding protein activator [Kofleriaceae bacterium]|nr:penicillin-binding protein activator [Kofleriaceae bacterium]